MAGCWIITDEFDTRRNQNVIWSNNSENSSVIVAEAITSFDLGVTIEKNVRNFESGTILMNVDNKRVWKYVTNKDMKSS